MGEYLISCICRERQRWAFQLPVFPSVFFISMWTLIVLFSIFLKNYVSQNKKILDFVTSFISPLSFFLFEPSIGFTLSVFSLSYPNLSVIPCFFFLHFQSLLLSLPLSKLLFFALHCCFSSLRWQNCLQFQMKSLFLSMLPCPLSLLSHPPSKGPLGQFWCVLGGFFGWIPEEMLPGDHEVFLLGWYFTVVTLRWFLGAVWKWRGACEFQLSFRNQDSLSSL